MTRWKHDLDDNDREVLKHLMGIAKVLQDPPQSVIDWNAAITAPEPKPKSKRRRKRG